MPSSFQIFREVEHVANDAGAALSRGHQHWMFDRANWFELAAKYTLDGTPLVVKAEANDSKCWLFLDQQDRSATALGNWYCLRYGVVTEGPQPPYGRLIDGLRDAGIGHIYISPTGAEDGLVAELRRRGWLIRREQVNVSWRVQTAGMSFDEYWAKRPSRLRNTFKRKSKKSALDCQVHKTFDATLWADVCDVLDNSWKKPDGTPDLTREMFRQEAEAGTLRLGLAYKDGKVVAAQLWTIERGVAIIHLLSYRKDAKQLGAGTVLSHTMFRHAIDVEKVDLIDFGIGDHNYKQEWMSYYVPLYALTAYDLLSRAGIVETSKLVWRKARGLIGASNNVEPSGN